MFFEKEDDAKRYAMMLEDSEKYNLCKVTEVDEDLAKKTCHHQNIKYVIITPNDIVVPPEL